MDDATPEGAALEAVLIYDGECPFCSAAGAAIRRLDDVGTVSWYDDAAQAFLEAAFDDPPFALVLVDEAEGRLYLGRTAARELAERAGMPDLVGDILDRNYDAMAAAVQRTVGSGGQPATVHGTRPLGDDERAAVPDLLAAARDRPALDG